MISSAAWKSLRTKRSGFPTVPTAPTTMVYSENPLGNKHNISSTPLTAAARPSPVGRVISWSTTSTVQNPVSKKDLIQFEVETKGLKQ
jgi:hypothetical protein